MEPDEPCEPGFVGVGVGLGVVEGEFGLVGLVGVVLGVGLGEGAGGLFGVIGDGEGEGNPEGAGGLDPIGEGGNPGAGLGDGLVVGPPTTGPPGSSATGAGAGPLGVLDTRTQLPPPPVSAPHTPALQFPELQSSSELQSSPSSLPPNPPPPPP